MAGGSPGGRNEQSACWGNGNSSEKAVKLVSWMAGIPSRVQRLTVGTNQMKAAGTLRRRMPEMIDDCAVVGQSGVESGEKQRERALACCHGDRLRDERLSAGFRGQGRGSRREPIVLRV